MTFPPSIWNKAAISTLAILAPLALLAGLLDAQNSHKKSADPHASGSGNIQQELVRTETGFYEAWKKKDEAYFRTHIPENGIFWGESGTSSRDELLQQQRAAARVCNVEGYGLSDFRVLPLVSGAYLLTYQAEQYATCNGEKAPVHMNGSSIYVLRAGQWQAIYRAQVPLRIQSGGSL